MDQYVVTCFDAWYWNRWAASWLGSLKEFTNFSGKILILQYGEIPHCPQNLCESIPLMYGGRTIRNCIYGTLSKYAREHPGQYIYWDADAYFQADIADAFETTDKFVTCGRGMVGGTSELWRLYSQMIRFDPWKTILDFPLMQHALPEQWNFRSLGGLSGEPDIRVVHVGRDFANSQSGVTFEERYPLLHTDWKIRLHENKKRISPRKMMSVKLSLE